jgi:hypothetical protein
MDILAAMLAQRITNSFSTSSKSEPIKTFIPNWDVKDRKVTDSGEPS